MRGKAKARWDPSRQQRQEEHREHLGIDALANLLFGHAHLLHDFKPGLVLISLGNLLVVHNQHSGKDKHNSQQDAQEEQATIQAVEAAALLSPALHQNAELLLRFGKRFQSLVQTVPNLYLGIILGLYIISIKPVEFHNGDGAAVADGSAHEGADYLLHVRHKNVHGGKYLGGVNAIVLKIRNLLFDGQGLGIFNGNGIPVIWGFGGVDKGLAGLQGFVFPHEAVVVPPGKPQIPAKHSHNRTWWIPSQ